jgi:VWFA-related protein
VYVASGWSRILPYVGRSFSRVVLAQAPQNPPQPTFRTEANYVRVDAYPTRDGAPVADLAQADFEVLENGVAQRIEQFEHVVIRGNIPQDLRAEPNTVAQSREALQNPRARVFVVFLDIGHVDIGGSHNVRKPLVDALNTLIGPDDLVAVMTPEMSATDLAFARRTTSIEGFLARDWTWGDRDRMVLTDPVEQLYEDCYGRYATNAITREMVDRRREKMTLDALADLVAYLRGVREERKAVITITNGWVLYGPNPNLAAPINNQVPTGPTVGVDPRNGKLTARGQIDPRVETIGNCERDRVMLSQIDDRDVVRVLPSQANRANVSFYPIDPRGLAVFDSPISNPLPLDVDAAVLRARSDGLRILADNTDGIASVGSNDLNRSFRRIVDDLSSYYLLGYYSSGRLDGRFHSITVRVKRPGIQVRARRGYLAASPADATAAARTGRGASNASTSAPKASPASDEEAKAAAMSSAVAAAISPLAGYAREVPMRLQIAAGWKPGAEPSAGIWLVGEIGGAATVGAQWDEGFDATATLTTADGGTAASGRVTVARNVRTFRIALTPSRPLTPGEYLLRVGVRTGAASIPPFDGMRLTIPPPPDSTGALFLRRGVATGNRDTPTADLRFRRSEQVRVEIPTSGPDAATARLLDRAGKPLAVPVAAAVRDDPDGSRWQTAQLALAPLAPGDYVIEIASGEKRSISAFRVVP